MAKSYWKTFLERLFRLRSADRELEDEIQSHLAMETRERMEAAENPESARAEALKDFGNVAMVKETTRGVWGGSLLEQLGQDLRFGARVLRKSPGYTALALAVLALGIGANTAIFSIVNGTLLRPLPFQNPEQLVQVWHVPPAKSFPGMTEFAVSAANYFDWKKQNQVFDQMAILTGGNYTMTGSGEPESLAGVQAEPSLFSVLGTQPILGRTFAPDEDQPGKNNVVVLTYAFWKSHFGGDPEVIHREIKLNGEPYRIIGVMGKTTTYPDFEQKIWTPLVWTDAARAVRGEHHYLVVARLKPGMTVSRAQAEMSTISERLAQAYPADDAGWGAVVVPLHEEIVGEVRPTLLVLLGAVGFVLLIACANVANLTLAKMLARRKEIAIRTALGASHGRVMLQVLIETILLAAVGGALGIALAYASIGLIIRYLAQHLPRVAEISLDSSVLIFALVISVLTGLLAGAVPAWRLSRANVNDALKQGMGRSGMDGGGNRTRSALVGLEVALALMLLIGAGLMIRSLWYLRGLDPGFDPHNVMIMELPASQARFATPAQQSEYFNRVLEKVRAQPGIEAAAVVDDPPLRGGSHQPIAIEGRPVVAMADQPEVDVRLISTGYLKTMRIPIIRGRDFSDADSADRPGVVLISEAMAKRFWPNEDPIGKHLTLTFFPDKAREIIGIVGDVKLESLEDHDPSATLYTPLNQISMPSLGGWRSFGLTLVARSGLQSAAAVPGIIQAVHEVDAGQPVVEPLSMETYVGESLTQQRSTMLLLAIFAGLALALAVAGIYGVLSYNVRRSLREIGIRMALGAQRQDVVRMVVMQGMRPAAAGIVLGVVGAVLLSRFVGSIVYGVRPTDLMTFAGVIALLAFVSFCAGLIPAYRATRVQPLKVLREE